MTKESYTACEICNQQAELKYANHVGYQIDRHYDIYHCLYCQTAFAFPLEVNLDIYNHIYRQLDQVPGYDRYLNYANQVLIESHPLNYLSNSECVYWSIQQYFKQKIDKKIKVLEIGCGFGYLTYALSKAGYDVLGIDISQVAVNQAIERYGPLFICTDVETYANMHKEQFDVVILTEVIEHIKNVKDFLNAAGQLLKPGGDLVLTTPNKSAHPVDILWETEPPPVHLWWFSEDSFCVLAKQMRYQATFMDFTDFNLQEIEKKGDYEKPYIYIRQWKPSRLPRLDEQGKPLHIGNVILLPLKKFWFKKLLNFFKLLKPLQLMKKKLLYLFNQLQPKNDLKFSPVLCAILCKPQKSMVL
jgi:SAM-dependent methyltransferase